MNGRPVVVHYHIFKNAGSSVDAMLQSSFGERWAPFEGTHAGDVQSSSALSDFLQARPEIEAVSTHLGRPPLPWPGCLPIVFLRHPMLRAASVYEFVRQDATQPGSEIARRASFADYVRWALDGGENGIVIRDYQVVHLSDASFRTANLYETMANSDDLRQGCALLAEWGVVGIVERFAASCAQFQAAYGKLVPALKLEPVWRNRTNMVSNTVEQQLTAIRESLGEKLYDELSARNELDMQLYQLGASSTTTLVSRVVDTAPGTATLTQPSAGALATRGRDGSCGSGSAAHSRS